MDAIIKDADEGLQRVQKQAPLVDRLHALFAARVDQNGFGREWMLSLQPKRAR